MGLSTWYYTQCAIFVFICIPSCYYEEDLNSCVQHARLRMHCSHSNEHMFSKNLVDSLLCSCGSIEDIINFFLTCPLFLEQYIELYNQLFALRPLTTQLPLFGSKCNLENTNSYTSSNAPITTFDIQQSASAQTYSFRTTRLLIKVSKVVA